MQGTFKDRARLVEEEHQIILYKLASSLIFLISLHDVTVLTCTRLLRVIQCLDKS